jgi:hypothetical protein
MRCQRDGGWFRPGHGRIFGARCTVVMSGVTVVFVAFIARRESLKIMQSKFGGP